MHLLSLSGSYGRPELFALLCCCSHCPGGTLFLRLCRGGGEGGVEGRKLVVALCFFDFFEEMEGVVEVMEMVEELCVACVAFCCFSTLTVFWGGLLLGQEGTQQVASSMLQCLLC